MTPRLNFECPLGLRKRNPDINFLFLSKVPVNEAPPGSPTGPLWSKLSVYKALFYISLKFPIKISLNKEIFSLLSKALRKERPSMSPRSGSPMETDPLSRALLSISFGVPSK